MTKRNLLYKVTGGKKLEFFRKDRAGLSIRQFASLIGCDQRTITFIEHEKRVPSLDLAFKITEVLSDLLGEQISVYDIWALA